MHGATEYSKSHSSFPCSDQFKGSDGRLFAIKLAEFIENLQPEDKVSEDGAHLIFFPGGNNYHCL